MQLSPYANSWEAAPFFFLEDHIEGMYTRRITFFSGLIISCLIYLHNEENPFGEERLRYSLMINID